MGQLSPAAIQLTRKHQRLLRSARCSKRSCARQLLTGTPCWYRYLKLTAELEPSTAGDPVADEAVTTTALADGTDEGTSAGPQDTMISGEHI